MAKGKVKKPKTKAEEVTEAIRAATDLLREAGAVIDTIRPRPSVQQLPPTTRRLTPLEFLGLPEDANEKEIKQRRRELAKLYHSDRNKVGDEMMKKINSAFDELKKRGRV